MSRTEALAQEITRQIYVDDCSLAHATTLVLEALGMCIQEFQDTRARETRKQAIDIALSFAKDCGCAHAIAAALREALR